MTAAQLRILADRARASAEGVTLHWRAGSTPPPPVAARQCASVWASLARSRDAPCAGLALSRAPDGEGGYLVHIRHADTAPLDATVTDTATGAPLEGFDPSDLEAGRLAAVCLAMPGPVCPLTPSQSLTLWRLRPEAASQLWAANGWPRPSLDPSPSLET